MSSITHQNNLKVLFIGDIVARPGREAVAEILPRIRCERELDLVIANVENLSGGRGINEKSIMQMVSSGVDVFTGGNHIFFNKSADALFHDSRFRIVRPANYATEFPGIGCIEMQVKDKKIVVMNFEGQVFMKSPGCNPFICFDEMYKTISHDSFVVVDFHAEATSEKQAFGFYVDGKVNAVIGSHTHVPTADAHILPNGTLYVTDVGMVGVRDSVLGVKKDLIINRFITGEKLAFEWEYSGEKIFNAVYVHIGSDGSIVDFSRCDEVIA